MGCSCLREDQFIKQVTVEGADKGIIPEELTDTLSNSIVRIEYILESKIYKSTGFFIKLNIENKLFHFLFTCKHSIEDEVIESEKEIVLYYGKSKNEKDLKIKLDKNQRIIKIYKGLDLIMIEILQKDSISEDKYLLPDFNYLNGFNEYDNKQIYIAGYPSDKNDPSMINHKKEKHFSSGIIRYFDSSKVKFYHSADTRFGSSGSPIINSDKKVVGIHCGAKNNLNYGSFIGAILNEINKEGNIEKIDDNKSYEIKNDDKNVNKDEDEQPKEEDRQPEEEQPKEDIKANAFDLNSYMNNLMNSSPIMTLSQENMTKFGNLLGNNNYMNYVKNYYSNPIIREGLKKDKNFQELLKINPVMQMAFDNPEIINKIFSQEMVDNMSKVFTNGNSEEINAVDQKIKNIVLNELKEKNDNNNE